jgi:hypothetical protein
LRSKKKKSSRSVGPGAACSERSWTSGRRASAGTSGDELGTVCPVCGASFRMSCGKASRSVQ